MTFDQSTPASIRWTIEDQVLYDELSKRKNDWLRVELPKIKTSLEDLLGVTLSEENTQDILANANAIMNILRPFKK